MVTSEEEEVASDWEGEREGLPGVSNAVLLDVDGAPKDALTL